MGNKAFTSAKMGSVKRLLVIFAVLVCTEGFHYHGHYRHAKIVRRETKECDPTEIYRRADGRCNNLGQPDWGTAGSTMPRFMPNAYADGVSSPRQAGQSGDDLPGPRTVSLNIHGPSETLSQTTLMFMQWGQFFGGDLGFVPRFGSDSDCVNNQISECLNIAIPPDDEYFTDRTSMTFVRSTRMSVDGVEEQMNSATAVIDASHLYGTSPEQIQGLLGKHGTLRHKTLGSRGDFLPPGPDAWCRNTTREFCFEAGNSRVNAQPGLAAMHNIFMREHNRIAGKLRRRNTHWGSNRIFEETRRIMAAEFQHITYNDYLPIVLGPELMDRYGLRTDQPFTYRQDVNPAIRNEFMAAASRFGHSLIPEELIINNEALQFKNLFLRPTTVLESLDGLVSALSDGTAFAMDRKFSHSVTRHLFQEKERAGWDLVSRNIQRGRDHGVRPLNEYRKFCSEAPFTELSQVFPGNSTAQSTYQHVDDVDLYSGGVAESPVAGGLIGPTFACLIARQYSFIRNGDRFFYLNRVGPQSFTDDQLNEVKKITLSKIICENSENQEIQENVFLPSSDSNPRKDCSDIPDIDLDHWKE